MPSRFCFVPMLALVVCAAAAAHADERLAAFRTASEDETRFVVWVEPQSDETKYQVELLVGKVLSVDCNRHTFGGKLSRKTLLRGGQTYHAIKAVGALAATRMACPDAATHDEFVTLGGEPYMVPYRSNAPIVVYVPVGFEVRYRLWRADETLTPAAAQ